MDKMIWDPSFSVGAEMLDEQHKGFFAIINQLIEEPDAAYSSEKISDLLTSATKYAVEHFRDEEAYLEAIKYPDLQMHKMAHKKFLVKISNATMLVMEKKDGPTDLLEYLSGWLVNHILVLDVKYKRWKEQAESAGEG